MTSGNEKGRRFFGWSKPTKRHPKICDLFSARLMFFSRKAPIQKGRRRRKVVAIRICPSSNHVSCSESAIKIYGSKEEIRLQKSPETVDAPGFAPDASIPVTLYGMPDRIRTCDLVSRSHTRYPAAPRAHIYFFCDSRQIVVNDHPFFLCRSRKRRCGKALHHISTGDA